jgi:hypothetical protein
LIRLPRGASQIAVMQSFLDLESNHRTGLAEGLFGRGRPRVYKVLSLSPRVLSECINVVGVRQAALGSAFVAAVLHPSVVAKTVDRALQDDGMRERRMLQKATGFL